MRLLLAACLLNIPVGCGTDRNDNTRPNPFVQRALQEQNLDQPIPVHLGEQTLDEMCIALFAVVVAP